MKKIMLKFDEDKHLELLIAKENMRRDFNISRLTWEEFFEIAADDMIKKMKEE